MIITSISEWRKGKYLISLNDEPAFVLYGTEIRRFRLKEGEELDQTVYEMILNEVLLKRAKSRTLHILDRYDKTEKELRDKLKEGMYPPEVIDAAVDAAKRGKYLDDLRYAVQYIYEKSSRKSRRMIEADLLNKGVSKECVDSAFLKNSEDNDENGTDPESDLIRKLIKKRCPEPGEIDKESEQKLFRYLTGKGFEFGMVKRIFSLYREGSL